MDSDLPDLPPTEPKRRRGRPVGSKNKPKFGSQVQKVPVQTPPQIVVNGKAQTHLDFKYADPETLAARNMSLIDHAQQALRHELGIGFQADGKSISQYDVDKIVDLCSALDRAAAGMLRVQKLAQEIARNDTPEQTLEKAVLKIMGQDTATLRSIIQRLDKHCKKLVAGKTEKQTVQTATDAIAALSK